MKKVVITGATGFIGGNLAKLCLKEGYEVYAPVRPDSDHLGALPVHENLHMIPCALEQILDVVEQIGSADAFFHLAWGGVNRDEIDSASVQDHNITMSLDCVRMAHQLGCGVFMDAGSRVEYGVTDSDMVESMNCRPVNEYGKAKLAFYRKAKALCEDYGMTYYHLRFFSVYGYGDHPWSIISTLIRQLQAGEAVALSDCKHLWNFMYIEDAVRGVYELYQNADEYKGSATIINVASQDTRPLRSFVEEIHEILGHAGSLSYGDFEQAKEGAVSLRPVLDRLAVMTKEDFVEHYTFKEGILETLEKEAEQKNEEN